MASSVSNAAYETHILHDHKPLDFNSLKDLPESNIWQGSEKFPVKDSTTSETMPVIDFTDTKAMELIGHVCKTWGTFQLTNHGIPKKLLDDIEKASQEIFALPLEQKLKVSNTPNSGIAGYGRPRIATPFSHKMWSKGFTVFGSTLENFRRLWPEDYSKYWYVF